jgi:hypothetical protein
VVLNPLVGAVCHELSCRELATVVRAEHPELVATLLRGYLVALDGACSCHFGVEQLSPHIAGGVIDEQEEIAASSRGGR